MNKKIEILLKKSLNFAIIYLHLFEKGGGDLNNIELIDFLREKNTRIVAAKMLPVSIMDSENASDFDVFNIFCEKLYLLAANPLRERFLRAICEASRCDIKPIMLYDCEYRKKLWQKMFLSGSVSVCFVICKKISTENPC